MSIFSKLVPDANPNHNPFDLSRRDVLSMKSAMLTPIFCQHTIPDATYQVDVMNEIQVNAMAKSNFARMNQNIEYYFVPYNHLWRWFETFYYQRVDATRSPSNVLNPVVPTENLHFNLSDVVRQLRWYYIYNRLYSIIVDSALTNIPGLASDYSRNELLRNLFDNLSNSIVPSDTVIMEFDVHGIPCVEDSIRLLDNLGYGNFLSTFRYDFDICMRNTRFIVRETPYVELFGIDGFREFMDRLIEKSIDLTQGSTPFSYFAALVEQLEYLFENDSVEVGVSFEFDSGWQFKNEDVSPYYSNYLRSNQIYANPYPILAYLKLFNDFFKSTQYDTENFSYYFNFDYLDGSSSTEIPVERIMKCLIPRYRLYRRDLVTGLYPNSQFGDVAVAVLSNPATIDAERSVNNATLKTDSSGRVINDSGNGTTNDRFSLNTGVSALAIRQAEALQRYREKNLRAGSRLTAQQKAFFGDKSQFLEDDYSKYIAANDTPILLKSVIATSESNEINLGDKGSYGEGAIGDTQFTFHSHDFGMIIGIMYIIPMAEYESYGIEPQVLKLEAGDYFHVDLQNLGLSPVHSDIIDRVRPDSGGLTDDIYTLGYSAHDWEYKASLDRIHGEFNSLNGVFGDYVTPRKFEGRNALQLSDLYCSPNDIDEIFYEASDNTQASDQFKVNCYHKVKAILPMSVTGLPY